MQPFKLSAPPNSRLNENKPILWNSPDLPNLKLSTRAGDFCQRHRPPLRHQRGYLLQLRTQVRRPGHEPTQTDQGYGYGITKYPVEKDVCRYELGESRLERPAREKALDSEEKRKSLRFLTGQHSPSIRHACQLLALILGHSEWFLGRRLSLSGTYCDGRS